MVELIVNYLDKVKEELKLNGKYHIAFVGDSLTSCEWIHPNWREIVEYVLKEELQKNTENWRLPSWGLRCFNCGYDGATTKDILNRSEEIVGLKPNLVIGLMGGNDPLFGIEAESSKENISKIFEKFDENGIDYAWATSLPDLRKNKNETYKEYRRMTLDLKKTLDLYEWYQQWNLEYFFTFRSEENVDEGISKGEIDPTHPNQLGNAYVAKYFLKELFGINFYPDKFIEDTLNGEKYPGY